MLHRHGFYSFTNQLSLHMGYTPRYFVSKNMYAMTFRTIEGLPFVATLYMKLLILGIMARAQRDAKLVLSHFLWMANHSHILAIFKDPQQAVDFYAEVEKKLTDSVKALLGLPHLRLWERRPVVAQVLTLSSAIEQVAYLYANPARANLVDSIAIYPGSSSWEMFQGLVNSERPEDRTVGAKVTTEALWVPYSKLPQLPARSLRHHQDLDFTEKLTKLGVSHPLELYPNAWMECFGVTTPEGVAEVNGKILKRIEEMEAEHRAARTSAGKGVLGEKQLRVQSIMLPHIPKDRATRRRIFVICSDKEMRIQFIKNMWALCKLVRQYYLDALQGINRMWPPGMFRPPLRAMASALR